MNDAPCAAMAKSEVEEMLAGIFTKRFSMDFSSTPAMRT
jgi:hypothetical protein